MSEPKYKPGQEVRGRIDCYRLLIDAKECEYDVEWRNEGHREWRAVPREFYVGRRTILRRKPEPSKPIVASVEGMINYAGKLVYFATGVYEIADLYDERLADVAEVNKGQRASLTLTIYPEGCEVSDTVTVPRAVVDRLLGCYCDSPYSSHPDLRAHLDKLAEAVKGGGE